MRHSNSVSASCLAVLLPSPDVAHAEARLVRDIWSTPNERWGSSVLAVVRAGAGSLLTPVEHSPAERCRLIPTRKYIAIDQDALQASREGVAPSSSVDRGAR